MVEILFLGTGGGRFNLISQLRRTAGFCITGSFKIYVDPGPGSLLSCKKFLFDPRKVDILVVTHNHIDHTNDSGLIAEAMSDYSRRKKGLLIASKSVIDGDEFGDRGITKYHMGKLKRVLIARHGKKILIVSGGKKAVFLPIRTKHEDASGFGFVLEMDGKKIGYTSDTEYFPGLPNSYSGCDLLIANNLKSAEDSVPGHLYSLTTARLLSESKPKVAIITHMGKRLILSGPEKEAKRISGLSNVRTIAAKDGMKIRV